MEQWIRVRNERDRLVLAWLRARVGDPAVIKAAASCSTTGAKPYLSAVCMRLKLVPPLFIAGSIRSAQIGERSLADIYQILQRPKGPLSTKSPRAHAR